MPGRLELDTKPLKQKHLNKNEIKIYTTYYMFNNFRLCKKRRKKQNFLFISIDDLRPTLQTYGYPNQEMITPNMDKLAIDGIQFNNAFTNIAVCGASRASIMTGIRPSEKRFNDFSTRASNDTPKQFH